jgi:hypothetical protein
MSLLATATGAAAINGDARLACSTAERANRTSQGQGSSAYLRSTPNVLRAHSGA